jgi:hypothetical protein
VSSWIDESRGDDDFFEEECGNLTLKNPEIPILNDYRGNPGPKFWENFPSNYPESICKKVDVNKLRLYVQKCWFKWSYAKRKIAKQTLSRLKGKLPVDLVKNLDGISCKNAQSAIENGKFMTDQIANWIKKKFVAGPFAKLPAKKFRVNPLMAAVQRTKVRPIMNLTSPKGASFNEAVDMCKVQKLTMSSPKLFANSLVKAGQGAVFAKSDIQDAYKLIPNPVPEWRLYGFKWLGQFFFDTTLVFGSKCAPANFDCLAETLVNIVCTEENLNKGMVHRQLDDVPVVSARETKFAERFSAKYEEVCKNCQVPLAETCPEHEKAFGPSTYGTVLGTIFDSETMEWSLSRDKIASLQKVLAKFMGQKTCTLKDVQKLHGKLANFAQMCEFMKGFRYNLLQLLKKFEGDETAKKLIGTEVKEDLWVWKKAIATSHGGMPLGALFGEPPLKVVRFISDAAGAAFEWKEGRSRNITEDGDRGVASVEYDDGRPISVTILRWPDGLLTKSKSRKGAFFGSKSGTLEMVGLLLPFLSNPKELAGRHIVLEVDNTEVVYGWAKKQSKNDAETSLLIRCLHVMESLLECKIYVSHVKRCSTNVANLADQLTRNTTCSGKVMEAVTGLLRPTKSKHLEEWLSWPVLNWNLPLLLCNDMENLLK